MFKLRNSGAPEATDDLFALASGPNSVVISSAACVVNGVRFVTCSRDERHRTQNSGVSVAGTDGNIFYGVLEDVIQLNYMNNRSVVMFKCKWFDTDSRRKKVAIDANITSICTSAYWYKDDPYILASQARQVFYMEDLAHGPNWRVVSRVVHRDIWDLPGETPTEENDQLIQDTTAAHFTLTVDLGNWDVIHLVDQTSAPQVVSSDEQDDADTQDLDDFIDDDGLDDDQDDESIEEEDDLDSTDDVETDTEEDEHVSHTDSDSE